MRLLFGTSIVLVLAAGTALAQKPNEPTVHVGLFNYGPDARVMGFATANDPNGLVSHVWTNRNGCQIGAGSRKPPEAATDAWEFATHLISADGQTAVVQLDWRKTIDDGKVISGTNSAQQLTLTRREPVVLDSITPLAACSGTAVVFEARYDVDFIRQRIGNLQVRGSGGGGARSGSLSGAGAGSGGGGGSGVGMASASSGSGSGGGFRIGSQSKAGIGSEPALHLYNVELWFIHAVGGREEVVAHPTMRMNREGASFSFNPIAVTAKGATGMVQITGRLRVTMSDTGEEQLQFTTVRRLTSSERGVTPPITVSVRDGVVQASGTSTTTHPLPRPEEVLAFEMPPVRLMDGQELRDKFSVRIRIAPAQQK